MLPYGVAPVLMIGIPELLDRINHDLLTGRAFSRGYDEYCFPVATADEQVATFCYVGDSTLLLEKNNIDQDIIFGQKSPKPAPRLGLRPF